MSKARSLLDELPEADLGDFLMLAVMAVMVGAASFLQTRTGKLVYLLVTIAGVYSLVTV